MSEGVKASPRSFDAELREWAFTRREGHTVAVGRVYADRKLRWPDGYAIVTSPVVKGPRREGAIITTANTRYLLTGPRGELQAMLALAANMSANHQRRSQIRHDERLFDLLPAAWGMDDRTFERVAKLPEKWMWQWRNHYRAPTDEELARIRRLMSFHEAIRIAKLGGSDYATWWRLQWRADSPIGDRSPLDAVLEEGDEVIDMLERMFRSQAGW